MFYFDTIPILFVTVLTIPMSKPVIS